MDPRAADWAYWAAAADNHEFLLYRLPQLVERAVIAYPTTGWPRPASRRANRQSIRDRTDSSIGVRPRLQPKASRCRPTHHGEG
jgi:hypothetical protein